MVFTCSQCGSKAVMPGVDADSVGRVVCGRCGTLIVDAKTKVEPSEVDARVYRHAVRLRVNGIDDEAIRRNLHWNGLGRDAIQQVLNALDTAKVKVQCDERPTLIGWIHILLTVLICAGVAYWIGVLFSGATVVFYKLLAIPAVAVAVGFAAVVYKILEALGVKLYYLKTDPNVTDSLPIDFSDVEEIPGDD